MYIYIRSMSEAQTEVYRKISAASDNITEHITKILMFPDCEYIDHWMHEIWSFLPRVSKLKGRNKFPKASFIKKCLSVNNDILPSYISTVKYCEPELTPREVSLEELTSCVEAYQDWLASELASKGYSDQPEVKAKLKEICKC